MKKIILSLIIILLITGCSKEKKSICKVNINNEVNEYEYVATFKIYSKDSFVTKIEKEEEYISDNSDMIEYFEEAKDIEYNLLNNKYGGYEYKLTKDRNKVKITTVITLKEVDLNSMVKDEYLSDYYVNKNKLSLGGIKYFYESIGASCDI